MVTDIEGAESIIDNILFWSSDHKEQDISLKHVFDKPHDYNMKLGIGKYKIKKPEVTYVGHCLTSELVKRDREKNRAVNNMKIHTCVQELQTFKGLSNILINLEKIGLISLAHGSLNYNEHLFNHDIFILNSTDAKG